MTTLRILSAATVLSMMAATPVFAQSIFCQQEPSACGAMYHSANVPNARASVPFGKSFAYVANAQHERHTTHTALTPPRSGKRHGS